LGKWIGTFIEKKRQHAILSIWEHAHCSSSI
jgi:hypothetical protein